MQLLARKSILLKRVIAIIQYFKGLQRLFQILMILKQNIPLLDILNL